MSLVEQIENLSCMINLDESFEELKSALDEYHELVKSGLLIPRENKLPNGYATYVSSNIEYSNAKV